MSANAKETKLTVTGMTCGHCVAHVKKALLGVSGVEGADVEQSGAVVVRHGQDVKLDVLVAAVAEAGYSASA